MLPQSSDGTFVVVSSTAVDFRVLYQNTLRVFFLTSVAFLRSLLWLVFLKSFH